MQKESKYFYFLTPFYHFNIIKESWEIMPLQKTLWNWFYKVTVMLLLRNQYFNIWMSFPGTIVMVVLTW